ncbi:hypothetical protein L210DRAFT_3645445 [Boletus edulis BED1]|uniref:Uncharacterized protein n=1 Tax=Boletus edulis BED1 TaxID=1328754 RepID=A0AAD4GFT3_BOLED|nr:hypothetical protein L210DRAFT_3645445 [Boletus edulis BED1]
MAHSLDTVVQVLEDNPKTWTTKPPDKSMNPLNKPPHMEDFNLDLCALLPFAGHCPRLCMLRLYINTTEAEIPSLHTPLEPFRVLCTLSLRTLKRLPFS